MSDGDNATPGYLRGSGGNGHDESPSVTPQPLAPNAAPWERWQKSAAEPAAASPAQTSTATVTGDDEDDDAATGSHSGDGTTVAELIAKLGAPARPRHHRAAADDEPDGTGAVASAATEHTDDEQTVELPPLSRPDEPKEAGAEPRRRLLLLAGRVLVALIAVLALALTGGAWQWSNSKNKRLNTVVALDPASQDIVDPGGQYGDENFLIVGADTRAGDNGGMGAGDTEEAGGARSDTIMLVNIPANRQRVVVVSFPRDLAIHPLYCEAWNPDTGEYGPIYDEDTGTYGNDMVYTQTKLNSTYSFGGPKCLVKEIQKLSGLSINRFMAVDFAGFATMVDALGGVEVCTTNPLYDYELGTVLDESGHQVINGATALNYVRARSVTTEFNGDYGRIKRQQLFLSSLLRSLISKDTFFSLTKLNNVVDMFINDSYVDNVKTKDLVSLGQSLQGVSAGRITFVTVPTGETDENGDEPPRTADMRALFDAIIDDDPLPGENDQNATSLPTTAPTMSNSSAPATSTPAPSAEPDPAVSSQSEPVEVMTTAPRNTTVQVFNSTEESGLATKATNGLQQYGFNVMSPDDYPSALKATTVLFSPGNQQAAATVASAFGNAPIQRVRGKGQVVQVVLGPDFGAVNAPAPKGAPITVQMSRGTDSLSTQLPDDLTVTNAADTTCE